MLRRSAAVLALLLREAIRGLCCTAAFRSASDKGSGTTAVVVALWPVSVFKLFAKDCCKVVRLAGELLAVTAHAGFVLAHSCGQGVPGGAGLAAALCGVAAHLLRCGAVAAGGGRPPRGGAAWDSLLLLPLGNKRPGIAYVFVFFFLSIIFDTNCLKRKQILANFSWSQCRLLPVLSVPPLQPASSSALCLISFPSRAQLSPSLSPSLRPVPGRLQADVAGCWRARGR